VTSAVAPLIFISYAEEDSATARALAQGLEREGFVTWYYTRDSVPGREHYVQSGEAIERSAACLFLISTAALASGHIKRELGRAVDSGLPLVPLLIGMSDAEYKQRKKDVFRHAFGAATSIRLPESGVVGVVDRVVAGLRGLDITPGPTSRSRSHRTTRPGLLGNELSLETPPEPDGDWTSVLASVTDWNVTGPSDTSLLADIYAEPRTISANDLAYLSTYTAARLDWHLDDIKRGDGFLTRTKVEQLARLLQRQIDRDLARGDDARFLRKDLQLVERIREDMVAKNLGALDYLPDQFRALPERLRPSASELWMVYGKPEDMQGKNVITQRTIDQALMSAASRGESYKLDDFRAVAKHLGFIP
jgi:hypothetical protein